MCLTGGIACGKSLLSRYLNELGVETLDADDIVHELIPVEERKRLSKTVFANPAARKELEERIHPLVKARFDAWWRESSKIRVAVIPLLFEVQWDAEYDIICCVVSSRDKQIERMMDTRGYTREEAEARLASQLPAEEKAKKSQYIINNDGTPDNLRRQAELFVKELKVRLYGR